MVLGGSLDDGLARSRQILLFQRGLGPVGVLEGLRVVWQRWVSGLRLGGGLSWAVVGGGFRVESCGCGVKC